MITYKKSKDQVQRPGHYSFFIILKKGAIAEMKAKDMEAIPINVDLLNLITPQGIEIKNNKVQLGETTHKLQYISGYPSTVNVGWLMNLKDMKSSTVSLLVTPIEDIQTYVERNQ